MAIERFESALELRGSREEELPDVAESFGRAYVMVGELDRSIAVFERALASAEQLEDEVYEELGDPHRARELHELAAERPGPGSPTRRLAREHAGKAEAEAAYEHMEKAVGRQQNPAARPAQ